MNLILGEQPQLHSPLSPQRAGVADLVEGIGTEMFGTRLVDVLHDLCGADHCAVFTFGNDSMSVLACSSFDRSFSAKPLVERYLREGYWRRDPAVSMARAQLVKSPNSMVRLSINDLGYSDLRPRIFPLVRDRVLVCGRRNDVEFGLSVVRTQPNPEFESGGIEQLANISGTLLSAMAKHVSVLMHKPNVAMALTELCEIENCFLARSNLPRRELEVCARVLYGLSSVGIALDLGVGEESVKTYRKRAYQRLSIGSERELLHWYLAQWSAWRGHLYAPISSGALH